MVSDTKFNTFKDSENCSTKKQWLGPSISHLKKYISINKGKSFLIFFLNHKYSVVFKTTVLLVSVRIYSDYALQWSVLL